MNNKDLLYSAGNHIQKLIISYNGKESEKECVCVCVCVCVYMSNPPENHENGY